MALWGLGPRLGLGATYGALVLIPFVLTSGMLGPSVGAMLGAKYGTLAGLPLGLLEGLVLGVVTVLRHRGDATEDTLWYQRAAQIACVVTCILAVVSFWGIEYSEVGLAGVREAFTRDLLEAFFFAVGPLLLAPGATWFAARRVAGQYARKIAPESPPEERQDEGL